MMFGVYNYKGKRKKGSDYNLNNIADFHEKNICCFDCGETTAPLDCEHLKPLFLGGEDKLENLQILCKLCHLLKQKIEKDPKKLEKYIKNHKTKLKKEKDLKYLHEYM